MWTCKQRGEVGYHQISFFSEIQPSTETTCRIENDELTILRKHVSFAISSTSISVYGLVSGSLFTTAGSNVNELLKCH